MNHNQQENRPSPGGRRQQPGEVPSQLEAQAERERRAGEHAREDVEPRDRHEREARRARDAHGTSRAPSTGIEKFGEDMPREQQAREGEPERAPSNPARRSDSGVEQNDLRRDLPGAD